MFCEFLYPRLRDDVIIGIDTSKFMHKALVYCLNILLKLTDNSETIRKITELFIIL